MPAYDFTGLKFFGCTVKSFSQNMAFGNQSSTARISLVEDFISGDLFTPPPINSICGYFYYDTYFIGILKEWKKTSDFSSGFEYSVVLEDPRQILEGVALIMSEYNDTTYGVPNILNVYGYLENAFGFGGSGLNPGGIPWFNALSAINAMVNSAGTPFGGPINLSGQLYGIDLSELPSMGNYYRVFNTDLMSVIKQICDDAGCDFFVELTDEAVIKIRTVSRRFPPPLGIINSIVDSYLASGLLASADAGLTGITDITSSFVIGGKVTTIEEANTYYHYFGKTVNGIAIRVPMNSLAINTIIPLNGSEIADLVGDTYACTPAEMLIAQTGVSQWSDFIAISNPALAAALGLTSTYISPPQQSLLSGGNPVLPSDLLNLSVLNAQLEAASNITSNQDWVKARLYNFVKKAADEFLGKQFLVPIPFVLSYEEPETGVVIRSHEPTDSGYKEISTGPPIGLNVLAQDKFGNGDGTFGCFVRYAPELAGSFEDLEQQNFVVQGNGIFSKAEVDKKIVFATPTTPCALVKISSPVTIASVDGTGIGLTDVSALFNTSPSDFQNLTQLSAGGGLNFFFNNLPAFPLQIAVPLISNILRYGPWYAVGAYGKTQLETSEELVPWNYGGTSFMNLAGLAKVSNSITFMQSVESGSITIPDFPSYTVGSVMSAGGPLISNMTISYDSPSGVVTTYQFEGYAGMKAYGLAKQNIDRIQRIIKGSERISRELRIAIAEKGNAIGIDRINRSQTVFKDRFGPAKNRNSPHTYIVGACEYDTNTVVVGVTRTAVSMISDKELARSLRANDNTAYKKTAAMSMDGLIRPFQTWSTFVGDVMQKNNAMSNYTYPNVEILTNSSALHSIYLDPFKLGNDIDVMIREDSYVDAHNYIAGGPGGFEFANKQRPFSLRGPIVVTGWGWSVDDYPVPNANGTAGTGGPLSNYLKISSEWKTGAVDLLWDEERGIWTSHGFMIGVVTNDIPGKSSGPIKTYTNVDYQMTRKKERTAYNFFTSTIKAGSRVTAAWIPEASKWYVVSVDC